MERVVHKEVSLDVVTTRCELLVVLHLFTVQSICIYVFTKHKYSCTRYIHGVICIGEILHSSKKVLLVVPMNLFCSERNKWSVFCIQCLVFILVHSVVMQCDNMIYAVAVYQRQSQDERVIGSFRILVVRPLLLIVAPHARPALKHPSSCCVSTSHVVGIEQRTISQHFLHVYCDVSSYTASRYSSIAVREIETSDL